MFDSAPILLTLKLSFVTTCILLVIGIPLGYLLAYGQFRFKSVAETLVSMPLVLPPSVLGFYLLMVFSPTAPVGGFLERVFDLRLVFSFEGLVVGSVLFSLPFMVHPVQSGLQALPEALREASYTLGKSKLRTLFSVLLPNIKPSLISGTVLSFAHTVGEFGVVLMIGGNIPGQTKVASIAIYDEVESLNYAAAHWYSFLLFAITFVILIAVYKINRKALAS